MMFPGSGTIIDCEEVNGTYTSTILTSTTLLGSSPESNTLQDDIKVVIFSCYKSTGFHTILLNVFQLAKRIASLSL